MQQTTGVCETGGLRFDIVVNLARSEPSYMPNGRALFSARTGTLISRDGEHYLLRPNDTATLKLDNGHRLRVCIERAATRLPGCVSFTERVPELAKP